MSDMPDRIWAYVDTDADYPPERWSDEYRDVGYRSQQTEYVRATPLVAAAPDMLESLKECHDLLVAAHMGARIVGRARKAIAKAEGRK